MTETLAGVSPPEPKEPPGTGPSAEELEAAQAVTSPAAVREARGCSLKASRLPTKAATTTGGKPASRCGTARRIARSCRCPCAV